MKQSMENKTERQSVTQSLVDSNVELAQMEIYNELADQTTSRVDVLSHIHSQLQQFETGLAKRSFLAKEVAAYVIKS